MICLCVITLHTLIDINKTSDLVTSHFSGVFVFYLFMLIILKVIEENITYEIYQKKKKQHLKEKVSM